MKYLVYIILGLIPFNINLSHDHAECIGYFPPNNLRIPVTELYNSDPTGLTEEEFHDAIDRIERVYKSDIEALGKPLVITRKWEDGTVNARARNHKKYREIIMYGGLARHKFSTYESFISVACHEVGHFLGGRPTHSFFNRSMSGEGQSDYFAASKCLRKLFSHQENLDYIRDQELHPYPKLICDLIFEDENNVDRLAGCYRASQAGFNQAMIYRELKNGNDKYHLVAWNTPVMKPVKSTVSQHPSPQCRLDTYLRGAACTLSHNDNFDSKFKELDKGNCLRSMKNEAFHKKLKELKSAVITAKNLPEHINARPLCWYKPGDGGWKPKLKLSSGTH